MNKFLFLITLSFSLAFGFKATFDGTVVNCNNTEISDTGNTLTSCPAAFEINSVNADKIINIDGSGDKEKDFYYFKVKNANPTITMELDIAVQPNKNTIFEYSYFSNDNKSLNKSAGRRIMLSTVSPDDETALAYGMPVDFYFQLMNEFLPLYGACFDAPYDEENGWAQEVLSQPSSKITLKPGEEGYVLLRTKYNDGNDIKYPGENKRFDNKVCDAVMGTCQSNLDVEKFTCIANNTTVSPDKDAKNDDNAKKCWDKYDAFVSGGVLPKTDSLFSDFKWNSRDCDKADDSIQIAGIKISSHPSPETQPKEIAESHTTALTTLIGTKNYEIDLAKRKNSTSMDGTGSARSVCNHNNSNITKLELYDGNDKFIADIFDKLDQANWKIQNIEIPNEADLNYKQMYVRQECGNTVEKIFFDARPARILRTTKVSLEDADKLYAGYSYGFEANGKGNASIAHMLEKADADKYPNEIASKKLFCDWQIKNDKKNVLKSYVDATRSSSEPYPVHYDTKDFNNNQVFEARDINGKVVEAYNSARMEVIIMSKFVNKADAYNNTKCSAMPGACKMGYIQLTNGTNENNTDLPKGIYTEFGERFALQFDNIGSTQIFGHDETWTIFSQQQSHIGFTGENTNYLCVYGSASNEPIKNDRGEMVIGCDIGLSDKEDSTNPDKEVMNFYTFEPAIAKIQIDLLNSEINDSYGSTYWTYIRNALKSDELASPKRPFETADLNASVFVLGPSLENFCEERPTTIANYSYSSELFEADLEFGGSPKDPIIVKADKKRELKDYMEDFSLKIKNDALFVDSKDELLMYNANYEENDITTIKNWQENTNTAKNDLTKKVDTFKAGKSTQEYALNLERNSLLALNYIKVDEKSIEIDPAQNDQWSWTNGEDKKREIAIAYNVKGSLDFIDAAMIAPDFAHNNDKSNVDQAVYLAGYCDSNCDKAGIFGEKVPNHITYRTLAFSPLPGDEKSLFNYENATFKEYKAGADMINGFSGNEVSVLLQSKDANKDELEKYCEIFRNCLKLGEDKYGLTFKVFSATENNWHGAGDQGTTILDGKNADGKNTQNKRHRSNSRLGR